jgi:PAS domain S-box-containing protein
VWLRAICHVVPDVQGEPDVARGLMVDITRQKLAEEQHAAVEEQLRRTEERYRALVEQTPVVTYLDALGPENVTIYISPQVEALIGYSPDELTGSEPLWPSLLHPEDRDRVLAASDEAERVEGTFNIDYRLVARDGRVVWVHDQSVLIRDDGGRPLYWQGVWVDVTERMRAAELERALETERAAAAQLRSVDEMKNTFLQAVSHDLRTPLAAILGLAITLERDDLTVSSDEARELAARIAANARKLDRMVNDLLDIDRLGRGIIEPLLEEVDVGELVSKIAEVTELPGSREIHVDVEPVRAEVDVPKVERIVENLLANAARHTPNGTPIWVAVRSRDDGVLLTVEDTGPGVPTRLRAQIFEPFRQGPDVPQHSPGVGVGLTLVARFAELHGGRAWVEDRDGGGASFRVWLPIRPPIRTPAG